LISLNVIRPRALFSSRIPLESTCSRSLLDEPILDLPPPGAATPSLSHPVPFLLFPVSKHSAASSSSLKIQASRERTRGLLYSARLFSSRGRRRSISASSTARGSSRLVLRKPQTRSHGGWTSLRRRRARRSARIKSLRDRVGWIRIDGISIDDVSHEYSVDIFGHSNIFAGLACIAIFKMLKFLDTVLLALSLSLFAVFGDSRSTRTRTVGRCIMQYGNSIILCLQRSFVRSDTSARNIRRDIRDI